MRAKNAQPGSRSGRVREGELVAGRYRVEATLGRGGMGAVYRVVDEPTGRPLALKKLGEGPGAEWTRLRFRREFHTMARLRHPRIVEVYDYGLDREAPYYTMELLDGRDLRDLGPVPLERGCLLLRDVASALAFLHTKRLIHRDLAPRNVRSMADGRAKLIDFGVLATAGTFGDVAGTPPFIAPENVRGLPIDHRADLYGLGALSYWLLTGRHAYPARHIEDLEEMWRERPPPPSRITGGIPPELDTLVMSLLSLDPLARPSAAAEVIDRLGVIGRLEPMPEAEATRGYLASALLVGRQREVDLLRRRVRKARRGEGAAFVIEAPSGTGKSRLLRELGLEAQVAGAVVLHAGAESAGKGPYGLLRALCRSLLLAAPTEAKDTARRRAAVIGRVLPELSHVAGPVPLASPLGDPTEERVRLQSELVQWFLEVAARRTLVVLVDDIQRSDEASAAVLASLAHAASGRQLVVAVAQRSGEPPRAAAAIAAIRDASARIRLRGLEAPDIEELVRGLFGEVPHGARLARWLHRAAGGSPLYCVELVRQLVDQGVIRYVDGIWSVPEEPRLEAAPKGLAEAMEVRIGTLGPAARSLAEALCVHGGEITLSICVLVADNPVEQEVFAVLDDLLYEEILIGSGDSYRFRHDGIREALLRGLDEERRRRLHLRVGKALEVGGAVRPERESEVGWHLLWGGERTRGAELLARAGTRLYEAQSFSDAIAPLEAALEVYEQERRPERDVLALRHMLVMVGCFSDREIALRYADDTIAAHQRLSGMELAARLRPKIGAHLALALAITWAFVRWALAGAWRKRPGPLESVQSLFTEVAYAASVRSLSLHDEPLRKLVLMLEPLSVFKDRIANGAYLLTQNLLGMNLGMWGQVRRNSTEILRILELDRITPMREVDRRNAEGAARYMVAMVAALNQDPAHARELARLEGLALRFFDVSANVCRVVYHRLRGEEDIALELEARVDVQLVQMGSMWGPEATLSWVSSLAFGFTRDVLGLRRRIEELGRLIQRGFRLEPHLELARGEYLRERGELEPSREALERSLTLLPADETFIRPAVLAALAETLLAARDLEGARLRARQGAELGADPERGNTTWKLRSERVWALVEAAAGDVPSAAERLDRAIAEANATGSPSLSGALHEARVRVAVLAGETLAYELHRRETERWFRATGNPALIARIERLPDAPSYEPAVRTPHAAPLDEATQAASPGALALGAESSADAAARVVADDAVTLGSAEAAVSAVLTGCRGAAERAARSLALLVDAGAAVSGYLYLRREGRLGLAAPLAGEEPPDPVVAELTRRVDDVAALGSGDSVTHVDWHPDGGPDALPWRPVLLVVRVGGRWAAVGAAALVGGVLPLRAPSQKLCERLARELYEAGDVTAAGLEQSE